VRREELRYAWPQLLLALFAFTAWAFSLGGAFGLLPWYEQWVGGVALIVGALILTGLNKLIGTLSVQR
jgi:fatty acid desaturase